MLENKKDVTELIDVEPSSVMNGDDKSMMMKKATFFFKIREKRGEMCSSWMVL